VPRPCRRRSPLRPSHLADRAPSRWGRSVAPHLLPLLLDTVIAMGVFLCFLLALLVSTCSAGGERCVRQDKQAAEFAGKAPWPRRSMGASSPSGGGGGQATLRRARLRDFQPGIPSTTSRVFLEYSSRA
jgi:hypothetical protein